LIKEEFGIADSREEAQQIAISKLPPDVDYKIEIIDEFKPKILGLFGGHPAKVRAYYEAPDEKPKAQKKAPKTEKKQKEKKVAQPKTAEAPKNVPTEEKSVLNYIPVEELAEIHLQEIAQSILKRF